MATLLASFLVGIICAGAVLLAWYTSSSWIADGNHCPTGYALVGFGLGAAMGWSLTLVSA